jgi:uncharacterized damage-inducible protein DinB
MNVRLHVRQGVSLLALGAALALPSAGFAQGMGGMGGDSSMQKGGMVPPAQVLTKLWKQESGEFIALAEAMPADKFNFAPDDKMGKFDGVRTWAQDIKHVTEANYGFLRGFNLPGAMSRADVEKLQSRDQILAALKDSYAYLQKGIETVTPQNAFEDMDGKGTTRFGMIAYALIHNNDHLGQMVEYLRMNGMIPPESQPHGK